MEYLALKTTNVEFEMSYTPEKKQALKRVLTSHGGLVQNSIKELKALSERLDLRFTLDDLPMKASIQRVISNLRYEQELIESFKDEISK